VSILKDFYERDSQRFWDPAKGMVGRDEIIYPLLAGKLGTLLEFGCGAGSLLTHLSREDRFERVIGVDISETALRVIRDRMAQVYPQHAAKVSLLPSANDRLPEIATATIDVIVSVATIEHVLNPYVVLDELRRVAKPGATLICSVPNYAYLKHRITLLFGGLPRTGTDDPVSMWREVGWDGMHLHCFTKAAFDALLHDTGWAPQAWTGWGDRVPWLRGLRARYPGLLSGEIIAICKPI